MNEEAGGEDKNGKSGRPMSTSVDGSSEKQKKQKRDHQHLFPVGHNIETVPISGTCIGLETRDLATKVAHVTPSSKDKVEHVGNRYHYGVEKCDTKRSSSSRPHNGLQKRGEIASSDCREGS